MNRVRAVSAETACERIASSAYQRSAKGASADVPATYQRMPRYRDYLASYTPLRFGTRSWYRFTASRRRGYLSRFDGRPAQSQSTAIVGLINLEWQTLIAERNAHDGNASLVQIALNSRRLFNQALLEFERGLKDASRRKKRTLEDVIRETVEQR